MIGGGLTGRYNFRKMYSSNAKKSKYTAVLTTPEELRAMELAKQGKNGAEVEEKPMEAEKEGSIDEITKLAEKMRIGKKAKDAAMELNAVPTISIRSKGIKKPKACKKSQKQIRF